jgi:hypothetical protein
VVWDIDDDEYAPAIAKKAIYEVSRRKEKKIRKKTAKEQSTSRSRRKLKRKTEKTIGPKKHDTWESHRSKRVPKYKTRIVRRRKPLCSVPRGVRLLSS